MKFIKKTYNESHTSNPSHLINNSITVNSSNTAFAFFLETVLQKVNFS